MSVEVEYDPVLDDPRHWCNCSECDVDCVGEKTQQHALPEDRVVAGRINGRPFCDLCWNYVKPVVGHRPAVRDEEAGLYSQCYRRTFD